MKAINTNNNNIARTLMSGYHKFGWETIIGHSFGATGGGVMQVYEKTSEHRK